MMKIPTTYARVGLLSMGLLFAGASAYAADWDGGGADNEFSTALNWDDDMVPGTGSTQNINSAVTVERSVDSTADRTFVSQGGIMNVTGGTHSDSRSGAGIRNFVGRGSDGTVNQSGGFYDIGHMLSIGGGGANGNGVYRLTAGSLNISRGADSIIDGTNPLGRPSLELGDEEAAGSGLFEISGGSLTTRFGAQLGFGGTFHVLGSGASSISIGNNNNGTGWWSQEAGSILKASIDGGGLTTIFIDELSGGTALAEFKSGSFLELGFVDLLPYVGTWTVLELENADITNSGLAFTAGTDTDFSDGTGWSFNVDNSGVNGLLTVTYVPEPGTYALLAGCLVLAVVVARRSQ